MPQIGGSSSIVNSSNIANGAIINEDINAAAAIALSKLATDPLARANHTGTQLAATISDFSSAVATAQPVNEGLAEIPLVNGSTGYTAHFFTTNITGTVGALMFGTSTTYNIYRLAKDAKSGLWYVTHSTTLTVTACQDDGICIAGNYVYVFTTIAAGDACRRYDLADLANVTSITFSGTSRRKLAFSNNTDLYVYNGTSSQFDRFTVSGTTITNQGAVTYTSAGVAKGAISDGTSVWITDMAGTGSGTIRKYALTGGAATSTQTILLYANAYSNGTGTYQAPRLYLNNTQMLGICWGHNAESNAAVTGYVMKLLSITLP